MHLFISWSKERSRLVATILRGWIPAVIQRVKPWMSSEDIAVGKRWNIELAAQLQLSTEGLVCITPENAHEPWLNFEVGALTRLVGSSTARPVLLGMSASDLTGPLTQFQGASLTSKEEMFKLMESLNASCVEPLDPALLAKAFEREWDDLQVSAASVLKSKPDGAIKRSDTDKIDEILGAVRELQRQVASAPQLATSVTAAAPTRAAASISRRHQPAVIVDLNRIDPTLGVVSIPVEDATRVDDFLDKLYMRMRGYIRPYTYNSDWVLVDLSDDGSQSRRFSEIGTAWARANGDGRDNRFLTDVGIDAGTLLIAIRAV